MRGASDVMLMFSAAILAVVALWHFYWAAGGTRGLAAAVPQRRGVPVFSPGRLVTASVGCMIGFVAMLYAVSASSWGVVLLAPGMIAVMLGFAGLVFIARSIGDADLVGLFNRGGNTPFAVADRKIYSPLCLFLGVVGLHAAALRLQ